MSIKPLIRLSAPIIFAFTLYFLINLITLGIIGRVGHVELAAVGLGFTIYSISAVSMIWGMNAALDTLVSQAFGAGNQNKVGEAFLRALLVNAMMLVPIVILWWNIESTLLLLGQDPEISQKCAIFLKTLSFGLWMHFLYETIRRTLQNMRDTNVSLWAILPAFCLSAFGNYVFVIFFDLGVMGSGMATVLGSVGSLGYILMYIWYTGLWRSLLPETSVSLSDLFYGSKHHLMLSLTGVSLTCISWWALEIVMIIAGTFGPTELAAHSICVNIYHLLFMFPHSVTLAIGTDVGNNMGAGDARAAKRSVIYGFFTAFAVDLPVIFLFMLFRYQWVRLFTADEQVIKLVGKTFLITSFSAIFDMSQGLLAGPLRALGKQYVGGIANGVIYSLVAVPLCLVLGYVAHLGVPGLWWGILFGPFLSTLCFSSYLVFFVDWEKTAAKVVEAQARRDSEEMVEIEKN